MALKNYSSTSLIGGGSGALDSIDGAGLADLDSCMVFTVDTVYFYTLDDDSAAAESSPDVISPDANAGDKRWILVASFGTSGVITLSNAGLHLLDTNASHDLIIKAGSDLTADRILTITTGDAARTITLSGNPTLSDWFDQAVKAASSPTFAGVTLGNTGLHILDSNASHDLIVKPGSDLTADKTLTITTGDADRTLTLSGNPTLSDWFDQAVKAASSPTFAGVTLGNEGLHILDSDDSHDLIIKVGSDLAADRILTITTGDAARTLTLSGNPTLSDWFDQAVKAASSPTFAGVTLGNAGLHILDTDDSHDLIIKAGSDLTADRILTVTTGDAARTLIVSGDTTVDQDLSIGSSPAFTSAALTTPVFTTSVSGTAFLDEDDMASDAANKLASQQSIKAYVDNGVGWLFHVEDQKDSGTAGGTFTTGEWRTRDLNIEAANNITGASLTSNQFTLPAGTFDLFASAPAFNTGAHAARIYNMTDTALVVNGSSEYSYDASYGATTRSIMHIIFTIAAPKVFQLQHRSAGTVATNGYGYPCGGLFTVGKEVYSIVKIRRLS